MKSQDIEKEKKNEEIMKLHTRTNRHAITFVVTNVSLGMRIVNLYQFYLF